MSQVIINDFKRGPLDYYRNKATFDWKKLRTFIETEDVLEFLNELHNEVENHLEFQEKDFKSLDEERRITTYRMFALKEFGAISREKNTKNPLINLAVSRFLVALSPSLTIKHLLNFGMFVNCIRNMGSKRHQYLISEIENFKIIGAFCLTEISHGSNIKGMQTTAIYDKKLKKFILNSPTFEAAKCWAGNMGKLATHSIVYAQLEIDGVHYGLHPFVVPIRDPVTRLPYAGVIVGDMGKKIGLNGLDNGFVLFKSYEIDRECILNKIADVTENGEYVSGLKSENERYAASFQALSNGRVFITLMCEAFGTKALTIAIRYAAVRRQFSPDGNEEVSILEYQIQQYKLLPYLSAAYAFKILNNYLGTVYLSPHKQDFKYLYELSVEIHAISCASKPLSSWTFRDTIQECRETCGGHGYLKAAGLGDLRNDHDASLTYEGENNVLIQQTSNWLLKLWPKIKSGKRLSTPLKSVDFLDIGILNRKLKATNFKEITDPKTIQEAFRWLIVYYLKETSDKLEARKNQEDPFWAKNNIQIFYAKNLSVAYLTQFILQVMLDFINTAPDEPIKNVLTNLYSLYGLWSLHKFISTLYQGGYTSGPGATVLIEGAILELCAILKNDAVALIDAVAPPDFVLNSVLGMSDGEAFKHIQASFFQSPDNMTRPDWWREVVGWYQGKSKL